MRAVSRKVPPAAANASSRAKASSRLTLEPNEPAPRQTDETVKSVVGIVIRRMMIFFRAWVQKVGQSYPKTSAGGGLLYGSIGPDDKAHFTRSRMRRFYQQPMLRLPDDISPPPAI